MINVASPSALANDSSPHDYRAWVGLCADADNLDEVGTLHKIIAFSGRSLQKFDDCRINGLTITWNTYMIHAGQCLFIHTDSTDAIR